MKRIGIKILLVCVSFALFEGGLVAAKKAQPTSVPEPRQIVDFTKKTDAEKADQRAAAGETQKAEGQTAQKEQGLYDYEEPKTEEPSMGWMFFKTIFVLLIFGAGFYFFFKYVKKKTGAGGVGQGAAQVLTVVPLGPNKFLQVVDIGSRLLVLGVTDGSVSLLSEIRERDEIDRLRLQSSKTVAVPHYGFQDFVSEHVGALIDFIGRKRGTPKQKNHDKEYFHEEYVDEEKIDYLKTQRERLRKMNGNRDDHEK